jgi:hypothetical protein
VTTEKLKSVLEFYQFWLEGRYPCEECPDDAAHPAHLLWMTTQCLGKFIPAGDVDKAHRWLGFIQGCLLCGMFFTLAELREHSRTEGERK